MLSVRPPGVILPTSPEFLSCLPSLASFPPRPLSFSPPGPPHARPSLRPLRPPRRLGRGLTVGASSDRETSSPATPTRATETRPPIRDRWPRRRQVQGLVQEIEESSTAGWGCRV